MDKAQLELPIRFNGKVTAPEFAIYRPAILSHKDSTLDLLSLKLFHEILAFNHISDPDRHIYFIPYSRISTAKNKRVAQKVINAEIERICDSMQAFIFKIDKSQMEAITGEKHASTVSPFDRITRSEMNLKVVLGQTFKKLLSAKQTFFMGDLRVIRKFSLKHSINLYWLIISHQWKADSIFFELEDLKVKLGVGGKYVNRFDNFRSKVLDEAQVEFQDTWARFTYQPVKNKKKIVGVCFKFRSDAEITRAFLNSSPYPFESKLKKLKVAEHVVIRIRIMVSKGYYTEEHVENTIEETRKVHVSSKLKNPAGFFLKALDQSWYENEPEYQSESKTPVRKKKPVNTISEEPKALSELVGKPHPEVIASEKKAFSRYEMIAQYWGFSQEQAAIISSHLDEKKAYKIHYGLACNEVKDSSEAFSAFAQYIPKNNINHNSI